MLKRKGLTEDSVNMVKALFQGHKRKISIGNNIGDSDWIKCTKGVRQGCPLSTLLFALYLSELPNELKPKETELL